MGGHGLKDTRRQSVKGYFSPFGLLHSLIAPNLLILSHITRNLSLEVITFSHTANADKLAHFTNGIRMDIYTFTLYRNT